MNNEIDPHLTAKIVGSYVRHHTVGADQVSGLITSVHRALDQLGQPNQPEEVPTPFVSIRQSVRQDYVVCLDCGFRAKMLRRHITKQHGLSSDQYLKRWGLRRDHPLTALAYSERRSALAKELGLGRRAKAEVASIAIPKSPASTDAEPKPTRRRSARSASNSEVVSKAAAETPVKPRRSRSRAASP